MTDRMQLRRATPQDLYFIQGLLRENDLPFEDIPSKISCLFLASADSQVVGIGGLENYKEYGLLRSVVIEPSFRAKGYGRLLCTKLIQQAKLQGIRELYLLTITARAFFNHMGFRKMRRGKVPKAIQEAIEFRDLCPDSSICMRMKIR
jgi:amino-acid N-acetyltransferase